MLFHYDFTLLCPHTHPRGGWRSVSWEPGGITSLSPHFLLAGLRPRGDGVLLCLSDANTGQEFTKVITLASANLQTDASHTDIYNETLHDLFPSYLSDLLRQHTSSQNLRSCGTGQTECFFRSLHAWKSRGKKGEKTLWTRIRSNTYKHTVIFADRAHWDGPKISSSYYFTPQI